MSLTHPITFQALLDAINEGVYAADPSRRIVYWSKSAERITGWSSDDIVGKHCYDDMLCHVDKDGHRLCGEEHCPLHRSICTGQSSQVPIVVFAKTKSGKRVPLHVSVSPVRDSEGRVVGGVETFRDLSSEFGDIERSRKIQSLSIQCDLPVDERIRFTARYVPNDIIGGDYYAIARLDEDRYGFLLADVMGHGVPAALYTMCLSSLWSSLQQLLIHPREFAQAVNQRLHAMVEKDEAFAAALCGLFDLKSGQLRMVGAGGPPPLVIRASGLWESPDVRGLYFGVAPEADYQETTLPLEQGDCVLFFSDGAIEIAEPRGNCLGIEGLKRILRDLGYPASDPSFEAIETKMLAASNCIRFDDDVTFIEARVMEKAARK